MAGQPSNSKRSTRRINMVHRKSENVKVLPVSCHIGAPLLFVGNVATNMPKNKMASHIKVPSFSGDVAKGLTEQYTTGNSRNYSDYFSAFPLIKGSRGQADKILQGRVKCTSLSLERVESQGKNIFTEGLSSISKRNEPSLVFHRRDIHGANMPENVKVSREHSKVVFGVKNYTEFKHVRNKKRFATQHQPVMGISNSKILETQNSLKSQTEHHPFRESPISEVIKQIERKYGVSPNVSPHPVTPVTPFYEANYVAPIYNAPRQTPKQHGKQIIKKGPAKILSLTPQFDISELRSPRLKMTLMNEDLERFRPRKNKNKKRQNLFRTPSDINIREERLALKMSGQLTKYNQNKLIKKYVSESSLSEVNQDTIPMINSDGSFRVHGVFGKSLACDHIWIPHHICEEDTFFINPPPTAEASSDDELVRRLREQTVMTTLQEDEHSVNNGWVSSYQSQPSTPRERTSDLRKTKTRESTQSGKSSNFLVVPTTDTKMEGKPNGSASNSDDEDGVKVSNISKSRTISTQTTTQGDAEAEVRATVKTLELSITETQKVSSISVKDSSCLPDLIRRYKKFEPVVDMQDLDYVKDYATGRKSQDTVYKANKSPLYEKENREPY